MRNTRVLFAVSLVAGIGAALAVGCGSSKSSSGGGTPEVDASGDDGAVEASGGPGSGCSPISLGGPAVLCDPGMNLTCCVDLSGGFTAIIAAVTGGGMLGTCELASSCSGAINVQCEQPTDCTTGQSCCGSTMGDAGAIAAEFAEAGVDAGLGFDGSLEAAAGDINFDAAAAALSGIGFAATCAPSCNTSQYTLCSGDSDCKALPGDICATPPAAALGGGASIDGFSLSTIISFKVCQPPDAGSTTPPPSDAGSTTTPDAASDAGTTVPPSDAAPTDGATTG